MSNDMKTVRVRNLETNQTITIPAGELAPGMLRVMLKKGPDEPGGEEVWVDVAQRLALGGKAPYQHPPLSDDLRNVLPELQETFHDVYPRTLEEWADGFRRDLQPEQEIALWLHMARVFRHFTEGRDLSTDQRQDIFDVILACVNNGPAHVQATTGHRTLSRKRGREIANMVCSVPQG